MDKSMLNIALLIFLCVSVVSIYCRRRRFHALKKKTEAKGFSFNKFEP
jgi:uncharacterized membrane protein